MHYGLGFPSDRVVFREGSSSVIEDSEALFRCFFHTRTYLSLVLYDRFLYVRAIAGMKDLNATTTAALEESGTTMQS